MSNIQLNTFEQDLQESEFNFDGDNIREQDGLWSVFDWIQVIGGRKNPRDVWKRLTDKYPNTVAKCDSVKFSRTDGKKANTTSPACDRQTALEIIGLLPGEVGDKYRENAAKLFLRYIDADVSFATEIINRSQDKSAVDKHIKHSVEHSKYLESYHGVHDQLKAHDCYGIHHASYNKQINQVVGIPNGVRHEVTKREKLKLTMSQIAGELALDDNQDSKQWQAVTIAVNAGKTALLPFSS